MDELAKGPVSRKVVRSAWDARSGIMIVDVDSGTRTDVLISSDSGWSHLSPYRGYDCGPEDIERQGDRSAVE